MKFMLMMNTPRGTGEFQVSSWSPEDLKAHIAFMHCLNDELKNAGEPVSAEGLKALRANSTGKVLLVNFWATWCGPCINEFPDLETTYRMFRGRDFDLITVSTNLPDEREGVLKALQKLAQQSAGVLRAPLVGAATEVQQIR